MGRIRAELIAWLKVLESSVLYAAIIVTFVMQVARVEGQSMDPTLKDQDRLVVNKLAYHMGEPQPGDVVMMRYPIDPDKSFVKRMIAREGDTVQIVGGEVRVNGAIVPAPYVTGEHQSYDDWASSASFPKNTSSPKCSCDGGRSQLLRCTESANALLGDDRYQRLSSNRFRPI
jgi:signal peptidase I